MCYTVEAKTRKRVGYKIAKQHNGLIGSAFDGPDEYIKGMTFESPYRVAMFPSAPKSRCPISHPNSNRTAAYIHKKDAINCCYIYNVIIKVTLGDDVREGKFDGDEIISGKRLVDFKVVKELIR